ncbi:ABC transporter ATPase [Mesomycoplasma conjunctivae]|uniref:ABC transporter ATP-binding protein n=1 Tax=Mesomycoplasma conjunctivae (strain ATCC 25834 / NCTC 10147 / HRC/581) TaxID=572263 RepID=C5J7E1_MESCH|nr:ATP-binding cassette domain-containing protein [Mesomycoplasma conjunctivae]CAT05404.1 ABC transporter ATP-binding protein [Mesomycoplasma conjunctivae]VEU66629.1 ABC transporter ATPase [Mesomycoplasma conjunctivae]
MIRVENLTKSVGKKEKSRLIIKNSSFTIPTNKITAIVGQSGAGKTTLLNMIAKIIKSDSGNISFFDSSNQKITKPKIDLVFQNFNLIPNLNVKENIQIGNSVIGLDFNYQNLEKQAISININSEILKNDVRSLSGGEQQRVAILRALNRDADFILLDEPTGNLDPNTSEIIFQTLKDLSQNKTIVIVSHNLELVKNYADQILVIEDQQIKTQKAFDESTIAQNNIIVENKAKSNSINKLKIAPKFAKADIKGKIMQVFMMVFSLVLLIFSINFSFSLSQNTSSLSNNFVVSNNLDSITISKNKKIENKFTPSKEYFNEKDYDILKNNKHITAILPQQIYNGPLIFTSDKTTASSSNFQQILINDFFKQRSSNLSNFKGKFISNKNEILISENFAKELKLKNPLDKTINLKPAIDASTNSELLENLNYDVKVVGVYKSLSFATNADLWVNRDLIQNIEIDKSNILSKNSKLFSFVQQEINTTNNELNPNFLHSFIQSSSDDLNVEIIEGSKPQNFNEILVSTRFLQEQKEFNLKLNSIIQARFDADLHPRTPVDFKIVGIFKSKVNEFRYTPDFVENYIKKNSSFQVTVYHDLFKASEEENLKISKFFNDNKYNIHGQKDVLSQLFPYSKVVELVTFSFFVIFIIVFIVFLITYFKSLADTKKKTLGILKALGASSFWTIFYQNMHVLAISFFTLIISFIVIIPLMNPIVRLATGVSELDVSIADNSLVLFIVWLICSAFIMFVYLIISLVQYRKSVVKLVN